MARRGFRRRRKVNWFPIFNTSFAGDAVYPGHVFSLPVEANGEPGLLILPLTWDEPKETAELQAGASLADAIGSGYLLHRIVGKLFLGLTQQNDAAEEDPQSAMVAAGIFVARATGDGTQPIDDGNAYQPLNPDNSKEPWIWRRAYWFSNAANAPAGQERFYHFWPPNNGYSGNTLDGPHVDIKTKRKVVNDDRLWLAIGTLAYPETSPNTNTGEVGGWFDYRILGSLIRGRQSGVF